jgi:hypothetical protein
MPLKWVSRPPPPATIPPPRRRLTHALAAGSLLAVAFQPAPGPLPRAAASDFLVTNLNPSGPGSLPQAMLSANTNPGPDTIRFAPGLTGTIALTATLAISEPVSIQGPGPGALSLSAGHADRIFYLYTTGTVPFTTTISGLTLRDGYSGKNIGAAILNRNADLTLDHVAVISNTSAGSGGGIAVFSKSTGVTNSLTIRDSLLSGNIAFLSGGAIFAAQAADGLIIQNTQIVSNEAGGKGAGLFVYDGRGDLLIEDSTFAGNIAAGRGGGIFLYRFTGGQQAIRRTTLSGNTGARGGGIYLYRPARPTVLENSTISGNHATDRGGGVYVYDQHKLAIVSSTIFSNTAVNAGGGVNVHFGVLPITDTIIAGNAAPLGPDLLGRFQLRYDLAQITGTATISDAGGNLFGLDPLLGPLADNGGPTLTHLPLAGSPVLNAGDPAFAEPPSTDQRGRPRLTGRLDIGAVEVVEELFLPLVRRFP